MDWQTGDGIYVFSSFLDFDLFIPIPIYFLTFRFYYLIVLNG